MKQQASWISILWRAALETALQARPFSSRKHAVQYLRKLINPEHRASQSTASVWAGTQVFFRASAADVESLPKLSS